MCIKVMGVTTFTLSGSLWRLSAALLLMVWAWAWEGKQWYMSLSLGSDAGVHGGGSAW